MRRRNGRLAAVPRGRRADAGLPRALSDDRRWRGEARCAGYLALAFVGMTVLLDWASGGLTVARVDLWALLATVVFAVLRPPRVTAGDGWLAVRGLGRGRRVRTDALAGARLVGGIARAPGTILLDLELSESDAMAVIHGLRAWSSVPLIALSACPDVTERVEALDAGAAEVWGEEYEERTNYLRVYVSRLRHKLEPDPAHPRYLITEPWVGYRFQP